MVVGRGDILSLLRRPPPFVGVVARESISLCSVCARRRVVGEERLASLLFPVARGRGSVGRPCCGRGGGGGAGVRQIGRRLVSRRAILKSRSD